MSKNVLHAERLKPDGNLDLCKELKSPKDGKKKKSRDKFFKVLFLNLSKRLIT